LPVENIVGAQFINQFLDSKRETIELVSPPSPVPDLFDVNILVVDDAPENREIIKHYLTSTHATVDEAVDGLQCIQKVETHPYDLILMDIQMPGLDGLQATAILRQKSYSDPIIAITAHAMKEDRERCLEAGCNDHIAKPFKKADLLRIISQYCSRQPRPTEITL
jgi:CheY-like chemotaxis protein